MSTKKGKNIVNAANVRRNYVGSWAETRGLCETPFLVYLSESLVFGAVETHALAASSEGGLTQKLQHQKVRIGKQIHKCQKKRKLYIKPCLYSGTEKINGTPEPRPLLLIK